MRAGPHVMPDYKPLCIPPYLKWSGPRNQMIQGPSHKVAQ